MITLAFKGCDLPRTVAEFLGAAPEASVHVEILSPEEEEQRKTEQALTSAMERMRDTAEQSGLTPEKVDQILTEIDQEEDEKRRQRGLPVRDSAKYPTSVTNWD